MIGYVTLGSNDVERAAGFYDALAAELGAVRTLEFPGSITWGKLGGSGMVSITRPFDRQPASVGNGVMVALEARDSEQVQRLHAIALAHGGSCEGPPGPRGPDFYGAYFRDLDGNKLCAFTLPAHS